MIFVSGILLKNLIDFTNPIKNKTKHVKIEFENLWFELQFWNFSICDFVLECSCDIQNFLIF
jgi:hypothetical protein